MRAVAGSYADWRSIDYRPALAELLPESLLPHLLPGQTALDIGCSNGWACLFLAEHGINAVGIDINPDAVASAHEQAARRDLSVKARFRVMDIVEERPSESFDAVLMIRLLTCFPDRDTWRLLLRRAHDRLAERGLIYIRDFMLDEASPIYRARYEVGVRMGWRWGNFAVSDAAGQPLFVAHHHTPDELSEIIAPYTRIDLNYHRSLSMNGNECRMFEFIGRRIE